ncbi:condensation domain-containing protein [Fulvivirgaceae bacterium BMA12]|uniref:Condensation domain-containing protein n=1 Tax=Agaribacillus aureus TaxID=3051825 RepID=A0ABT8L7N4_9BACT|nr:condensation domain-containing protein [Fulvivirgaceae bacterium BMA12]
MSKQELKQRIEKLSPKQKALLALQLKAQHLDASLDNGHDTERLVAYIIDDGNLISDDFRDHLKNLLPDYMIPTAYVQLEEFPRLPNGKIDNQALPSPDEVSNQTAGDYAAPGTEAEKKLAAIWSEVLNFEPVGIHDNYFEIGGDSILSIQIIAKANKAGLKLKPNALFDHQTIAALAQSAETGAEKPGEDKVVTGEIPLLPIQHWFFEEHQQAPHHWNQGLIFTNTSGINTELLATAVRHLTLHHDALRTIFVQDGNRWKASIEEPQNREVFQHINLSALSLAAQEKEIKAKSGQIQGGLNLSEGRLFQGIYFDCGQEQHGKLYLFAHHLVVDAVSWGILVEDLKTICEQLQHGVDISLPSKTVSYKDWGLHLLGMADSGQFEKEYEFWHRQTQGVNALPYDLEAKLPVSEEHTATIDFALDQSTTRQLRTDALNTYNTRIDEFLIAVLTEVIVKWSNSHNICLGLERHGREVMNSDIDLSYTVGWCTAYFPLTLDYPANADAGILLKSVKERIRKIPNGGIGYGILRYLCKENGSRMDRQHRPPIIFNYLGNLSPFDAGILGFGKEMPDDTRHQQSERYHMLEINAFIQEEQLKMRWSYSRQLHQPDTIYNLVQAFEKTLQSFIEHCSVPNSGGFTPSDFPEAGLSQDDLDNLLGEIDS